MRNYNPAAKDFQSILKKVDLQSNIDAWTMSIGLLVVSLKYVLYVGYLSKWFVFALMLKFYLVGRLWYGRPIIGYNGSY